MFFETYKDNRRQWRWQLKAGNGRVLARSRKSFGREAFAASAARAALAVMQRPSIQPSVVPFRNTDGKWSWFVRDKQLHALAESAEEYTRHANAVRAVNKVYKAVSAGPLEVRSAP